MFKCSNVQMFKCEGGSFHEGSIFASHIVRWRPCCCSYKRPRSCLLELIWRLLEVQLENVTD